MYENVNNKNICMNYMKPFHGYDKINLVGSLMKNLYTLSVL